jgi:hypothetical protein
MYRCGWGQQGQCSAGVDTLDQPIASGPIVMAVERTILNPIWVSHHSAITKGGNPIGLIRIGSVALLQGFLLRGL